MPNLDKLKAAIRDTREAGLKLPACGDLGDLLIVLGSFVLPLAVVAYVVYRWQFRPPRATIFGYPPAPLGFVPERPST